jgi:GGDEF domain-containing protein
VLIEPVHDRAAARIPAERILGGLQAPLAAGRTEVRVTPSIGIALFPDDATDADALLRNADVAMFRAKSLGGNNFQFYAAG